MKRSNQVYSFLFSIAQINGRACLFRRLLLFIISFIAFLLISFQSSAQVNRYAVANGDWDQTSTWSSSAGGAAGASVPVAGDFVFIGNTLPGIEVTIPDGYSAACATLSIGAATNASNALTLAGAGSVLNVSGNVTITRPSGAFTNELYVNAGTATVNGSLTLAGTATNNNRFNKITITSGTLTILSDLIFITGNTATNVLDMSGGAGTIFLGGLFTGTAGSFLSGTGSKVVFNRSGIQTIPAFGAYNKLVVGGSGIKTFAAITVNDTLSMQGSATTAGSVPIFGASSTLEYLGSALQTAGTEFRTPFPGTGGVVIDNVNGVKLGATKTVTKGLNMLSGQLDLNAFSLTVGDLQGTATITSIPAGAVTLTVGSDNLSTNFSGIIQNGSGTLALTKNGTGTLTLSGLNSFSGLTTISAGIIKIGQAGTVTNSPLGTAGTGTSITSGAVLDLNGFTLGTAEPLTLRGTGVSSSGSLTNTSATDVTYSGLLTLGANSTIVVNAGDINITNPGTITGAFNLTVDGTGNGNLISILGTGAGTLVKNGLGTWTISGANTYTGVTTINAGAMRIGASTSVLGTVAGNTTVVNGAVLDLNGFSVSTAEPLTINGNGISASGALINNSATTSDFPGLLRLGTASSIIINNGDINLTATGTITGSGYALTLGGPGNGSLASIVGTAAGTLTKTGSGTWTLSGINTYTGSTTISAGTLKISGAGAGVPNGSSLLVDGTLDLNGTSETVGALTGTGFVSSSSSGTISFTAGTTTSTTFSGTIEDGAATMAFTKAGTGTLTLSGNNSYSGLTTISAGTIKIGAPGDGTNSPLGTVATGTSITSGAALDLNGITMLTAEELTIRGTGITSGGSLMNSSSTNVDYPGLLVLGANASVIVNAGDINLINTGDVTGTGFGLTLGGTGNGLLVSNLNTGAGTLTKSGAGTWTLSGQSTFTGATSINAGTIKIGAASTALGAIAGITTVASGAVLDLNGFILANGEPLTINANGISSSGALMNSSATPVSYSGLLRLGSASSIIVNAGDIDLTNAGIITGAGFNLTLGGSGNGSLASILNTTSGTLIKSGTGTWTISGANNHTGATTITAGILKVGASTSVFGTTAGTTTVSSGAELDLNGYNVSTAETLILNGTGIAGSGALTNSSATASTYIGLLRLGSSSSVVVSNGSISLTAVGTITGSGFDLTLDGTGNGSLASIIGTGSGQVIKIGTGMWTLSGANTFTGGTTLNDGTLNINHAQALGNVAGTFTIAGGVIDNTTAAAITTSNYPQAWNSNFSFTGTRNLNLGSGTITLNSNINTTIQANTLTATGTMNGGSYNLTKLGTGALTFGANAITIKDLTINAGTLTASSGTTNLSGDFTNNATYTHNSGLANFNGSAEQNISGTTATTFNNLTLNNSNGLRLHVNTNVSNTLTLSNGSLAVNPTFTLNISSGIAVAGSGFGITKHITTEVNMATGDKGYLRIGGFSGSRTFPVGSSAYYMPALINASGTNDFSVSVWPAATQNGEPNGSPFSALTKKSIVDATWMINRNAGSAAATIQLSWPDILEGPTFQNFLDPELGISYYDGSAWDSATGSGSQALNLAARNSIIAFGPFGVGKTGIPLGMKFKSISVYQLDKGLELDWSTLNEIDMDHYEIERSTDGRQFNVVGRVSAIGHTVSELHYSWIDLAANGPIYFYRVKAVDGEGHFTYSSIVRIDIHQKTSGITIFPNPVLDGHLSFHSSDLLQGKYSLHIYNSTGQQVYRQEFSHNGGVVSKIIELPVGVAAGYYILQLKSNGVGIIAKPFILH